MADIFDQLASQQQNQGTAQQQAAPSQGDIFDQLAAQNQGQQPQIDLSNTQGQGTYSMKDPTGKTVAVPYGQVQKAAQSGYGFASDQDRFRYAKDNAADPNRTTTYTPTANENTPAGHRAAVYAREDAAGPIGQVGIGIAKAAGSFLKPVSDAASVISGADNDPSADQTDYTQARNGLQTVGKVGGELAAVAPAAIEAPVALGAGLVGGSVAGKVGSVLGAHLGLNDKQTALLSDLFSLAGGAGSAGAAARFAPGGASSLGDLVESFRDNAAPAATASDASPVDSAVANAVDKSGIEAGSAAPPPPAPEDLQPALHAGIRQVANDVATDAGVDNIPANGPIRDAVSSVARGVRAASQADYQALDQASGGRWQRYDNQLTQINDRLGNLIEGVDDDQISNLEQKRNEIETSQSQMIEDLKEGGKVDPDIADRAAAQYRKAMALQDVGNAIKASTKPTVVNGKVQDVMDPNGLATRLAKLNDTSVFGGDSRLVQALGNDHADALVDHVSNAQVAAKAVKDFVPGTATGKVALSDLVKSNTAPTAKLTGGNGARVNWDGVLRDFEGLGADQQKQQFGSDVPQVRRYLYGQARQQGYLRLLTRFGAAGAAYAGARSLYNHAVEPLIGH